LAVEELLKEVVEGQPAVAVQRMVEVEVLEI
jgi:hypothetical protein